MQSTPKHGETIATGEESSLVGRLASEMIAGWQAGQKPVAEEYLNRHPQLWERLEVALELIAEELALRDEFGETISHSELLERFPQWEAHIRTLGECQRAFGGFPTASQFPVQGDWLGDFKLIGELGRGSHGRVFLALQSSLGERPVVLKLSSSVGLEHLSLARLQHTHIVPLHSAHEFPELGLRGLCMPYYGGNSLAVILASLAERPVSERKGADLLDALLQQQKANSLSIPVRGPMCDLLARASYTEAICRIGVCIAEALQFAHDRDLLHLDLKPSNVLIASDGIPMLLDFHLAHPPLQAGEPAPLWLGGTSGYMAPELATAIAAVRLSGNIQTAVDVRADIYSLGVLLAELLGHNTKAQATHLPTGLADILARCSAADPRARYSNAGEVANDLRRHIADLPLQGVPNRSIAEGWRKWRRRRPFAVPVAVLIAALFVAGSGVVVHMAGQVERASVALHDGEADLSSSRFSEAAEKLRNGESLLEYVPFHRELTKRIRQARERAERGQAAVELHALVERLRPFFSVEEVSTPLLKTAESSCRQLWSEREAIVQRLEGQATPELERRWRADLLDVAVLLAHLSVRLADPNEILLARRKSMDVLAEAETILGSSAGLFHERAIQARALGETRIAEKSRRAGESVSMTTTWERLVVARTQLIAGNLRLATKELDQCLKDDPGSLWANYYRGVCSLRLGEFNEAAAFFTACVSLAPRSGWCLYQRGLAHFELGRLNQARSDFDRALALDPALSIVHSALSRMNSRAPVGITRPDQNHAASYSQ